MKLEDVAVVVAEHEIIESKKSDKLAVLDYLCEGGSNNVLVLSTRREEIAARFGWTREHVDSVIMEMLNYPEVAEYIDDVIDLEEEEEEFESGEEEDHQKKKEDKQCWFDAAAIMFVIGAFSVVNVALTSYIIFKMGEGEDLMQ